MNKLKLELSKEKSDKTIYTNWQISKISNDFSEFYYKSILLHDINTHLKEGFDKNSILILNSSIDLNNQYKKYKSAELDLALPNDIVKLYHLGSPVSLRPSLEDLALYELFEAYRSYFKLANKYNLNSGDKKKDLAELFSFSKNMSNFKSIQFFQHKISENNSIDNKNIKKCFKEIEKQFAHLDNKLKRLMLDFDHERPYVYFRNIFNKYTRPIIAVKSSDNKIKLLGKEFFVQSEFTYSNARFLETNSIQQNSPLIMTFTMSLLILPYLLLILREKLALMENQNLNNQYQTKIAQLEQEILELESIAQRENIPLDNVTNTPELQETVLDKGHNITDDIMIKAT